MTRNLLIRCVLLLALVPAWARAQDYEFHPPASADDPGVPALIRDLAERLLPVYQDADNERYLANLSALQMADSNYAAADDARQSLRERLQKSGKSPDPGQPPGRSSALDLYAHARTLDAAGKGTLEQAFGSSFSEAAAKLGDREIFAAGAWLAQPAQPSRDALQLAFDRSRDAGSLSEEQALEMIWTWLALDARHSVGAAAASLLAKEGEQRFGGDEQVVIRGAGGGDIHIRVLRPKAGPERRTALLQYALDPAPDDALACAARGYAGVLAYSRVHGKSSGLPPFGHEGEDVRAVIRWIARQPWSDGRVGLYGDGYAGFAAWAAARQPPPQLKALATADPMVPGIDFPAPGRIFRNDAYAWALAAQSADGRSGRDDAAWRALDRKWYRSGAPYRDYDRMAGARNHAFQEWLAHPSYDRWWQKLIPYGRQFAGIGFPVLTIGGYFTDGDGPAGALYYFGEHLRYKADADHSLLLGPWAQGAARGAPEPILRGYTLDQAALPDLRELRLRWFDHVFRNGPLPPPLSDKVNYELMGANDWRHAPSLQAGALRFYLDPSGEERHRLSEAVPPDSAYTSQVVDLADRRDADPAPRGNVAGRIPPPRDGLVFASEPVAQPLDLGGALVGQLDFMLNRQDLDLSLTLYEQLANGSGLRLTAPCEFRGSYAGDRSQRHMLPDGVRQQLPFRCEQWLGRRVQAGSRLVLLLEVLKRPDRQINYGGGGEVSGETLEYVLHHIKLRWYGGSYIELPVRR
jgi:putative CocE/NonD family hydrolase